MQRTIAENLSLTQRTFKKQGISNAFMEARWLFCWLLSYDVQTLVKNMQEQMDSIQQQKLAHCVKRRCNHEPLAYITQQAEFYDVNLFISHNVLIPRSDTESLIDLCFELAPPEYDKKLSIVDIGTGSGCLIAVLAKHYKRSSFVATDISKKALDCARKNFMTIHPQTPCLFLQGNYLYVLEKESMDIIVSNPPYIATKNVNVLSPEIVLYEPFEAIDGGNDGLQAYRNIFARAPLVLKPNGLLVLEIGYDQEESVKALARELCTEQLTLIAQKTDLAGITRIMAWQKL